MVLLDNSFHITWGETSVGALATDGHRDVNQFAVKLTGLGGWLGKNNASAVQLCRKVIEFDQQIILAVHTPIDIHKCR